MVKGKAVTQQDQLDEIKDRVEDIVIALERIIRALEMQTLLIDKLACTEEE